jgi:AcrR family transcriptional regulator
VKLKENMKLIGKEVHSNIKTARLIDPRRKQIIKGAMQVISTKGFHGATVRDIAEAAGLTVGTMYNYVRSKEDILYIVYDFMTTILTEGLMQAISDTKDPLQKVRAALLQNMKLVHKYQDTVLFLYREAGNYDRDSLHAVLAQESRYIEVFEELLRQRFTGKKVNEHRLKLAADILSYLSAILVLRRWSFKRRYKSTDDVMGGILDFTEYIIDFVEEGDRDRVERKHIRKPDQSQNERSKKWGTRGKKK